MQKLTKNEQERLRWRGLFFATVLASMVHTPARAGGDGKDPWHSWHAAQSKARVSRSDTWDLIGQFLVHDRNRQRSRPQSSAEGMNASMPMSKAAQESSNILIYYACQVTGDPMRKLRACQALAQTIDALPENDPFRASLIRDVERALAKR